MTNLFSYPINPRWFKPWPVGGHWKTFVWRGQYWGHVKSPSRKRATLRRLQKGQVQICIPINPRKKHKAHSPWDALRYCRWCNNLQWNRTAQFGRANVNFCTLPETSRNKPVVQIDAWETIPLTLGFRPKCYIVSGRVRFLFKHEHDELQIHEIWRELFWGKVAGWKEKGCPYINCGEISREANLLQTNKIGAKNKVSFGTLKHLLRRKGLLGGFLTSTNPRYDWRMAWMSTVTLS